MHPRSLLVLSLAALLVTFPSAALGAATKPPTSPTPAPAVAGEIVVRLRREPTGYAQGSRAAKGRAPETAVAAVRSRYGLRALRPAFAAPSRTARANAASRALQTTGDADLADVYVATVPDRDVAALAGVLERDPLVDWAEPNYIYHSSTDDSALLSSGRDSTASEVPDDPYFDTSGAWGQDFADLWGLFAINATGAWEKSRGDGIIVAVVDSGVDANHPDLAENIWHNPGEISGNGRDDDDNGFVDDIVGWDFTRCGSVTDGGCQDPKPRGPDVTDEAGHGTHVSGTIAAVGENGLGIIGVAPQSRIMVVKALGGDGRGAATDLAGAVIYAVANGARVINASWSGFPSHLIEEAVQYALDRDVVFVAAAGNNSGPIERGVSPAIIPGVLTVGAVSHLEGLATFSNFGAAIDLVAPGGGGPGQPSDPDAGRSILSLLAQDSELGRTCRVECTCSPPPEECGGIPCDCEDTCSEVCVPSPFVVGDLYARAKGTSMAAPHVAGAVALVRALHPEFSRLQVEQILTQTARDLGSTGWDRNYGFGLIDAARAVRVEQMPIAQIRAPMNGVKVREHDFPLDIRASIGGAEWNVGLWELRLHRLGETDGRLMASGQMNVDDGVIGRVELNRDAVPGNEYVLELMVEDEAGARALTQSHFSIPHTRYAFIPIPDPRRQGIVDPTISDDGNRVAFSRYDTQGNEIWLFEPARGEIARIARGTIPLLSPDGRILSYSGSIPFTDAERCDANFPVSTILLDVDSGQHRCLPTSVFATNTRRGQVALDAAGSALAFLSNGRNLTDPPMNDDGSWEAFLLDLAGDMISQLSFGPFAPRQGLYPEVEEVTMSRDGNSVAFRSLSDLDPGATTGGVDQVFLFDVPSSRLRQITANPSGVFSLSLDEGGERTAYETDGAVHLNSPAEGRDRVLLELPPLGPIPPFAAAPHLSADGKKVSVVSTIDPDTSVRNEDLNPELFLIDVESGDATQVTDTAATLFAPIAAMDATGDRFAVASNSGDVDGLNLHPLSFILLPRREGNAAPDLNVSSEVSGDEGVPLRIELQGGDIDSGNGSVSFYAEFPDASVRDALTRTGEHFFETVLTDAGNGSAHLDMTPRYNQAGIYALRVAAFDREGGVTARNVTVTIRDTLLEGDADCSGDRGQEDVDMLIRLLFQPAPPECALADANDDGRIGSADMTSLLRRIASP